MTRRRALVFLAVFSMTVGCDHATKLIAQRSLGDVGSVSLASDTLRLELAANSGGFLSLGASLPAELRQTFFMVLVPLAVLAICVLLLRPGVDRRVLVATGLIAGGGLANWLDRLMNDGAVTDFVSLGLGPLRTGIFNLADVAIVGGIALALLALQRAGDRP